MRAAMAACAAVLVASVCWGQEQLAFEDVVGRLKAADWNARLQAVRMLAESGYPEAGAPMAPLLNDPVEEVQREALYTELGLFLGARIETRKHVALVVEVRDPRAAERAFDANWDSLPIAPVPREVVTGLLPHLRHPDLAFRVEATYALGVLGQLDGVPLPSAYGPIVGALADRLGDADPPARVAVALAAGRLFRRCAAPCQSAGLDRLADALIHTLNDPEPDVRFAAMQALADLRAPRAVQALTSAYDYYKKGDEALGVLIALARIGHPSSIPLFKAALSRKEERFRQVAAEGLGRAGDKEAVAAVDALAAEKSPRLRLAGAFAKHRAHAGDQLEVLIQAVDPRATREQAQEYLIEIGSSAAGPVAAALQSEAWRSAAPEARLALVQVLGAIGGPAQVAVLESFETDRNVKLAAAAERAAARARGRKQAS